MINQINDTIATWHRFCVVAIGGCLRMDDCRVGLPSTGRSNFVLTIGYRDRATLGSRVLVVI